MWYASVQLMVIIYKKYIQKKINKKKSKAKKNPKLLNRNAKKGKENFPDDS